VLIVIYASVMICTNHAYTILDDESMIVTLAGHPILPTLKLFFIGVGQNEHPPLSDVLLHAWLVATHFSFFALRIFANVFFIAAIVFIALSAKMMGGSYAYWAALALGFLWPFAFQYGRITGWYCPCMFLVSLVTWLYLRIIERDSYWSWAGFALVGILLVWSNYFGVAILFLLLADFLLFHRSLASRNSLSLVLSVTAIGLSFVPLCGMALMKLRYPSPAAGPVINPGLKGLIASIGYPVYAIFASVAVAPWFLLLSIPILVAALVLFACLWFSAGRRWFVYFILAMILLQLSGHMNVKRVLFLLPWMFLAMCLAMTSRTSRYPWLTTTAITVMVTAGWIGILSARHYATTNLYEPWGRVAQVVANDAKSGATIVSENFQFFFYMNYQLGLETETGEAARPFLGETLYRSHGYKLLEPNHWQALSESLRGKVVLVNGSAQTEQVQWTNALNERLRQRCATLGEYQAAPDPAAALKKEFAKGAAVLAYRTDVTWYDCSRPVN